ncbi:MAG: hypothetical protein A3J70_11140 [Elusimicrobia bacterium RIFCSPHIGHO2_02_FULL_61_10]|nr:MAG: hypothetical protein A3I76_05125 [Elusimicrobia bacterium RIFCSPLOWO2_02_FULL_61_11]OGS22153.1 MAG: hypothetical protein A3J70_11140 [Elusimicrobia bacterium RIFCSPHIGHO2_02_FULL_61_10]
MKKFIFICAALLLALPLCAFAGEFKDKGEFIAADFPSGWAAGKTDDPAVTLRLEKGKSFFEFSKQDSELGDYYLKARVKEQVDSLRSKGNQLSGDIRSVSLHGVSVAYYTSYESMGADGYIAFLTYNGVSYAVSARGLPDPDFRAVLSSVRKPGEKIELPKPKKIKVVRVKKQKDEDDDLPKPELAAASTSAVAGSTDSILNAFAVPADTAAVVEASTQAAIPTAGESAHNFLSELAKKQEADALPPYLPRKPLPLVLWAALIGLWVAGSFAARSAAAAYANPKLPPPPADVPPDFFFPFVISKFSTAKDVTYNVLTRQRQLLLADFPYEHELYVAGSVYGCVFFHVVWSLLAFIGRGDAVTNAFVKFPLLGRAFASLPEIFFIVPFIIGLSIYFTKERALQVFDAQSAPVMAVHPDPACYGMIRDGSGKEVARLVSKGTVLNRYWEFVDTDNLVVFSIRDDFPKGLLLRKLFGNLGGTLRSHYGIFAQDRRAGFIFLDPSSADRFQIHMDFAFARLGHPAQILAAVLYIISREKDPVYPSPF